MRPFSQELDHLGCCELTQVQGSALVQVTDGRLSLTSGPAASNNKLAFVDIATVPQPNLWEIVVGTPDLSTLKAAIEIVELEAALQGTEGRVREMGQIRMLPPRGGTRMLRTAWPDVWCVSRACRWVRAHAGARSST